MGEFINFQLKFTFYDMKQYIKYLSGRWFIVNFNNLINQSNYH